jgi:DNA-binding response OmpR family regulator
MVDILTLEGADPVATSSAKDAIALATDQSFDLALLDLNLPDLTGWDVLAELQSLNPPLPAVLISVSTDEAARQRAYASGALEYLVKPVAMGDLVALLRRHLGPLDTAGP